MSGAGPVHAHAAGVVFVFFFLCTWAAWNALCCGHHRAAAARVLL